MYRHYLDKPYPGHTYNNHNPDLHEIEESFKKPHIKEKHLAKKQKCGDHLLTPKKTQKQCTKETTKNNSEKSNGTIIRVNKLLNNYVECIITACTINH